MSIQLSVTLICIISYFLGSIPSAIWYGLKVHNVDIRTKGSGNAGATNTFRVFGKRAGIIVLLIDAGKGFLATQLAGSLAIYQGMDMESNITLQIVAGTLAIFGHLLPIFANFRGGKGVATLIGMVLCLDPSVALASAIVFLLFFLVFHYVSLGAIAGAIVFPIILNSGYFGDPTNALLNFSYFVTCLVIFTHRKNILRILDGTENKMYFIPKKKGSNS